MYLIGQCIGKGARRWRRALRGFSLIELLIVMAILILLMGFLFPVVNKALGKARQTECRSRLRQLGGAVAMYRAEHRGSNPDWLSELFPYYIDDREMFICPSDKYKGRDGGKPDPGHWDERAPVKGAFSSSQQFEETDDTFGNNGIDRCSYLYEFCAADLTPRGWWDDRWPAAPENGYSWQAYKLMQLSQGDANNGYNPYSESRLPIIRCFHHYNEGLVPATKTNSVTQAEPMTLNVGYAGNVFVAPLMWEERVDGTR